MLPSKASTGTRAIAAGREEDNEDNHLDCRQHRRGQDHSDKLPALEEETERLHQCPADQPHRQYGDNHAARKHDAEAELCRFSWKHDSEGLDSLAEHVFLHLALLCGQFTRELQRIGRLD